MLNRQWWLVLNNNENMELTVLEVPVGSLNIKTDQTLGLKLRVDKQDLLDLNINTEILIDRKSGIDFSVFINRKIHY